MTDMGKHSTPVDGVPVAANGHALAPFTIMPALQVRAAGPVSPWPQPRKTDRVRHAAAAVFAHRAWLAAIPVVLVNAVAFYGQLAFLRVHLPAPSPVQALVAVALESIAIYLAWQAHLAQLADDSAMRLRLAAYAMAAVIAAMNYSHYAGPHWRPTFAALAFALCSAISPWLWSVHSRRVSRDRLMALKRIEPHAVRLGVTRWAWHPLRSPRVMWHATWQGETDPVKALALLPLKPAHGGSGDVRAAVIDAQPVTSGSAPQARREPAAASAANPSPRPSRQPPKRTSGRDRAAAIWAKDGTLTDAEVAKRAKVSESTARRARAAAPRGQDPGGVGP
jgi:hypothetical protein